MSKQRLLLGALIFSVSGWVSASVPIIRLVEPEKVENISTLTGHLVSEGSFSSYASEASSSSSNFAPVADVDLRSADLHTNLMVASHPAPKIWAVLLLVLGCVIYQGRRRQRPLILEN